MTRFYPPRTDISVPKFFNPYINPISHLSGYGLKKGSTIMIAKCRKYFPFSSSKYGGKDWLFERFLRKSAFRDRETISRLESASQVVRNFKSTISRKGNGLQLTTLNSPNCYHQKCYEHLFGEFVCRHQKRLCLWVLMKHVRPSHIFNFKFFCVYQFWPNESNSGSKLF